MTHSLFLITYSQHRIFSTESCQVTSSQTTETVSNDSTNRHQCSRTYSLFSKECSNICIFRSQRNLNIIFFHFILFSLCSNLSHCLNSFYRIFSICSFTTQHQRVCTIIDCICNICNLCTSWTWVVNHGVQHLSCYDNRFLCQNTFLDKLTLNTRNTFLRNFNT